MKSAITLISAAHAAVALASFVAVRGVSSTLDGIRRMGGGIGDYSAGVADAVRWPLIAAWIAVGVSLLALLVARRNGPQERPVRTVALAAVAIGAGVAAVFTFRGLTTFITTAMLPPGATGVMERLTAAAAITVVCFVAALLVAVMSLRARATMSVAVLAVVVSLGVSATMIVTLRDVSATYQSIAAGDLSHLRH